MAASYIGTRQDNDPGDPSLNPGDSALSSQMKYTQKVENIIKKHLENQQADPILGRFLKVNRNDEIVCVEIIELMKKLDGRGLEECINAMVKVLLQSNTNLLAIDQIITKALFYLHEQNVAPVLPISYGFINSLDVVKFQIPINVEKVQFVKDHLKDIDYKGMRDLLKLVLVEKLDKGLKLFQDLSFYQRSQLLPLEDLTIDLLDRCSNHYPSLFIITEVCRLFSNSPVHKLPRLSHKIREVVASFRSLADVTTIICRPWTYPVVSMINYSFIGNSWKLNEHGYRNSKTHLPYVTMLMTVQPYFQYMILKQPKSQYYLNQAVKRNNYDTNRGIEPGNKCKYDEILEVLIMEAMTATESSPKALSSEAIQYNWRHISHLCFYALLNKNGNFNDILMMLKEHLKMGKFRKARVELMWVILQYVSFATNPNMIKLEHIKEVFNILYPDDNLTFVGSSGDSFELLRFFLPAAIWMNLAKLGFTESPPPKVANYIDYINNKATVLDDGLLAVQANSHCNDVAVFKADVCSHIVKKFSQNKGPYTLPFGIHVPGSLEALDIKFLDLLTFPAKNQLLTYLMNTYFSQESPKWPCPAIVESVVRIILCSENYSQKSMEYAAIPALLQRFRVSKDKMIYIFFDMLAYRLKNIDFPTPTNNRLLFIFKSLECCPSVNAPALTKLPLYVLMEQVIVRQMMVAPCFDSIIMFMMFKNMRLNCTTAENFGKTPDFNLTPELSRILIYNFISSVKLVADCNAVTNLHVHMDFIKETFKFPECTLKWLPEGFKDVKVEQIDPEDGIQMERMADMELNKITSMDVNQPPPASPFTLTMLFRSNLQHPHPPAVVFKIIKNMSIYELTLNLNNLVKYLIFKFKSASCETDLNKIILILHKMIFRTPGLPLERFLFSLIVHPNDNKSIKIALVLLHSLLTKQEGNTNEFVARLHNLYSYVPPTYNYFSFKSTEFFTKQAEYHRQYYDYIYDERQHTEDVHDDPTHETPALMYYSNLAERLVLLVDFLFMRCFEVNADERIVDELIHNFGDLYKYHPKPITALYKILFCLENKYKSESMIKLVRHVGTILDDPSQPKYPFLTAEFLHNNHQSSAKQICETIVNRVVQASTYQHEPPEFVVHDWRLSEFPPAAQAITSGCLELMASPKPAPEIIKSLIAYVMVRSNERAFDRLNAVAIILTYLPKHFQSDFYNIIERSFDWPELKSKAPDYILSQYHIEAFQYKTDRVLTLLATIHYYIQHASCDSLAHMCVFIQQNLAPKVNNETQLLYYLRILAVFLMKHSEREDTVANKNVSTAYLNLIVTIYDIIPKILQTKKVLEYEDLVCDLLYMFKYTVTGTNITEEAISRFPESMQKKLKFLQTQGVVNISSKLNIKPLHLSLIQNLASHNVHVTSFSEYNAMTPEEKQMTYTKTCIHQSSQTFPQHQGFSQLQQQQPAPTQQPQQQNMPPQPPFNQPPQFPTSQPLSSQPQMTPSDAPFQGNPFVQQHGQGPPQQMPHQQFNRPGNMPPNQMPPGHFQPMMGNQFSQPNQQMPPSYFHHQNQMGQGLPGPGMPGQQMPPGPPQQMQQPMDGPPTSSHQFMNPQMAWQQQQNMMMHQQYQQGQNPNMQPQMRQMPYGGGPRMN